MKKYDNIFIVNKLKELGYFSNTISYDNCHSKFTIYDKEGYYYLVSLSQLIEYGKFNKFHIFNPYSIYNIKLWLKINNKPFELISKEYTGSEKPLIFIDKEGYYYLTKFDNIFRGYNPRKFHTSNPYTIQNIKLWCKINNKPFILISDVYFGAKENLKWKCLKESCGENFTSTWSDILSGYGCGVCYGRQVVLSNCLETKNPELAKEWHPTKNGDLTPCDVTVNSNKKVWWKCSKGHEWEDKISSRNRYLICPYCNHQRPSEDYNLLVCNPELCKEWHYEKNDKKPEEYLPNSNRKVWWICKDCDNKWKAKICERNYNLTGCPECNKSKGEKVIKEFFDINNIIYSPQYKTNGCRNKRMLPFDFAIFENYDKTKLKMLIEYDGILHYEDKFNNPKQFKINKRNDNIKNTYCQNNNIKLLRIPYWDFDNIEKILKSELNIDG